uniref:Uncharacterized protein n=1 Tax=Tetranychus urticae TaxID=32264 RepID=T1KMZ0_TETUR
MLTTGFSCFGHNLTSVLTFDFAVASLPYFEPSEKDSQYEPSGNVNYKTSDESKIELEKVTGKIVPVTPEDEEAMKFQSFWLFECCFGLVEPCGVPKL